MGDDPDQAVLPGAPLNVADLVEDSIHGGSHLMVHLLRIGAFHEIGLMIVAEQKALQLGPRDASQHRGTGDLLAVEMEDGKHHTVRAGIEKLVGMPGRR